MPRVIERMHRTSARRAASQPFDDALLGGVALRPNCRAHVHFSNILYTQTCTGECIALRPAPTSCLVLFPASPMGLHGDRLILTGLIFACVPSDVSCFIFHGPRFMRMCASSPPPDSPASQKARLDVVLFPQLMLCRTLGGSTY